MPRFSSLKLNFGVNVLFTFSSLPAATSASLGALMIALPTIFIRTSWWLRLPAAKPNRPCTFAMRSAFQVRLPKSGLVGSAPSASPFLSHLPGSPNDSIAASIHSAASPTALASDMPLVSAPNPIALTVSLTMPCAQRQLSTFMRVNWFIMSCKPVRILSHSWHIVANASLKA